MKQRSKNNKTGDLEKIISAGAAAIEGKKKIGRPKLKVQKEACTFRLPVEMAEMIREHSNGNQSFFAEQVFKKYFEEVKNES